MGISYAKKMGISSKDHGSLKQWIGVRDKSTANHGFLFQSHQRCRRRREINTPKKKSWGEFQHGIQPFFLVQSNLFVNFYYEKGLVLLHRSHGGIHGDGPGTIDGPEGQ
jgi:hypothetical protein